MEQDEIYGDASGKKFVCFQIASQQHPQSSDEKQQSNTNNDTMLSSQQTQRISDIISIDR